MGAQLAANAAQQHADTTLIGPAQIALDMNANASKSVQAKFQAQLAAAQGQGGVEVATADKQLASITANANHQIQAAQNSFDAVSNNANQLIQGAADGLSSITDLWNNTLATDAANLSGTQTAAGIGEATAAGLTGVAQAISGHQFAGTGTTVNIIGIPTTDASAISDAVQWIMRGQSTAPTTAG